MMIEVSYTVYDSGDLVDRLATVSTAQEVDQLVAELARDEVNDAVVTHLGRPALPSGYPDHELAFGIRGERAALFCDGDDGDGGGSWFSRGDTPPTPPEYVQGEFPPYCEVPVTTLAEALCEFLRTACRPTCVQWQAAEHHHSPA